MRRLRKHLAVTVVMFLVLSIAGFLTPNVAQAESCVTKSRHWSMKEKSGPKFGWVELHMKLCTDGKKVMQGGNYTTMSAENDETGPGTLGGFQIKLPQPKLYYFNSGSKKVRGNGGWKTNGSYKSCNALSGNTVCSYTGTFQLVGQFLMYPGNGKLPPKSIRKPGVFAFGGRAWYIVWKAHCTNKYCQSFPRA